MFAIGSSRVSKIILGLTLSASTVALIYLYYRSQKIRNKNDRDKSATITDPGRLIYQEKIIPKDCVPGLIGKGGSNIKHIQHLSNTKINFKDKTLENGDRVCEIRGGIGDVSVAEDMIDKYLMSIEAKIEAEMKIPDSVIGRIIGRGGETIRSIQDQSNCRVIVDPESHRKSKIAEDEFENEIDPMRTIILKGSEEQINVARLLIKEKVDEEESLKRRINLNASMRTTRRQNMNQQPQSSSIVNTTSNPASNDDNLVPNIKKNLKSNIFEVFVSCVYNPNKFWIQIVGKESVELDKLSSKMTEFYSRQESCDDFQTGDFVAAPFPDDKKFYRAKILDMTDEKEEVKIFYLDYGDIKVLPVSSIYALKPEYMTLKYQAMQASLNLELITVNNEENGDWSLEIINEFCDLCYCAQWKSLTAKINGYLKDEDSKDVVWIELLDKDLNITKEFIRQGYAKERDIQSTEN